ncbi:alpha-ketoacid dehydrogenase subunit beta [Sedimentibacter hydroxybenzoicus DSM 7310]|uniref:Alpha-ketoacid dehydrogenase subunit beta n=1 Tax=Sedimentibacter hydroxybenzoicus DSM 7310 TaxID=1123245 RepID=A0A974GUW5_SEDHY|nr:alpha-ketoacid dehydrogenase subunit beta [Sedimentibacter hydroxybenzoicus]NYB72758.1 alpha-ketoacid dehydrogenase subunit beta [Sedimentibacter hydroxybenzoicus DSM 7310]
MSRKAYAIAIKDVLAEEMRRDDRIFIMGEDIAEQGGIFGCTRGLLEEFGESRVRNTPISEAGFMGAGVGAALAGMKPVVELMYMDFSLVAADQILNQAAKIRYMYGGKATLPLVIRGQQGIGRGNAATHSQSTEAIFMHIPGLKVAMPSTPADAAGLLRTALRDNNPIMFFEHKLLYSVKGEVPDDPDFVIPFGKANIVKEGNDVTIIATSQYVGKALTVANKLESEGICAEVIDPRTLVPFDTETVVNSVKKTGRAIVVHEAHKNAGPGAEIASLIMEEAFKYLDAPVLRLGAKACPLPFNLGLENAVVPQEEDIEKAVKSVLYK